MLWTFNYDNRIKECELRDNPIIITVHKFNEDSAREFCANMSLAHCTGQEVIPIVIDSYGGQVYSLMRMISAIKASRLPVATIVEGKAMSCGAILFSFGEEGRRYMDPHATVMIHDVSSGAYGKIEEIKANAAESERLNDQVYEMMARNCGQPDEFFKEKVHAIGHADLYVAPKDAKEWNLANHLRLPKLDININVEMKFA
jgi:ATP-dependent Clp protease, protease subunit